MNTDLFSHRSIRQYKADPLPEETIKRILEAGTMAANTGNMQVYSIIQTRDAGMRERLWEEVHFKQDMVKQAPLHLTFCADFNRFSKWCEFRQAKPGYDNFLSFMTGATDAILASQNVVVEAEAQGLGTCYLGTIIYNADKAVNLLKLPRLVVPVASLVVGFPDESPVPPGRLPLEAIVHDEYYSDFDRKKIDNVYKDLENSKATQNFLELNQKETLAQIYTEIRYPEANNLFFSGKFREVLTQQGFRFENPVNS